MWRRAIALFFQCKEGRFIVVGRPLGVSSWPEPACSRPLAQRGPEGSLTVVSCPTNALLVTRREEGLADLVPAQRNKAGKLSGLRTAEGLADLVPAQRNKAGKLSVSKL